MIKISGKVIHGQSYGRKLGFPTANLDRRDFIRRKLKVKFGVWAGTAQVASSNKQSVIYPTGIVIGPLDKRRLPKIEGHLIGFKGNLYGKKLIFYLTKYIRPFKKFKNEAELKNHIKQDLKKIKQSIK